MTTFTEILVFCYNNQHLSKIKNLEIKLLMTKSESDKIYRLLSTSPLNINHKILLNGRVMIDGIIFAFDIKN
jgi:hypothetical protein